MKTIDEVKYLPSLSQEEKDEQQQNFKAAVQKAVAENIEALWFVYLNEDNVELDPATASIADIRSVEITLVARIGRITHGYTDTRTYSNKRGTKTFGAYNDGYHRSVLSEQVRCRNLGL